MHLCIQLDWFPEGDTPRESVMQVDWVRQYSLDEPRTGTDSPKSRSGGKAAHSSTEEDSDGPVRELVRRMFSWR
jgi:hypothetical protein